MQQPATALVFPSGFVISRMCDSTHHRAGIGIHFEDDVPGLHDRLPGRHHLVEGPYAAAEAYVRLHAPTPEDPQCTQQSPEAFHAYYLPSGQAPYHANTPAFQSTPTVQSSAVAKRCARHNQAKNEDSS